MRAAVQLTAAIGLLAAAQPSLAEQRPCDPRHVLTATVAQPSVRPTARQEAVRALAKSPEQADIVIIGDSLARQWPYREHLDQFQGRVVWNYGVGWDRTENILWRLSQPNLDRLRPSEILLFAGTNNSDLPPCAVAAGIEAVVSRLHQLWSGARISVFALMARGPGLPINETPQREVNELTRMYVSRAPYARVVEVREELLTCREPTYPVDHAMGSARCRYYQPDLLHLTESGYDLLYQAWRALP